jgi:PAS domain S-box-containing protein
MQAERTRAILDSVLVGIVTVGERGIEWMNRSARRMFGGELADFVGEPSASWPRPSPTTRCAARDWLQRLHEGQAETFECRLKARDGREFWVVGNGGHRPPSARPARSSPSRCWTSSAAARPRCSIAQAQASLQRVIETAPLAIALFDARSLRVLQLNQMAAAFFGRRSIAMQGRR